MRPFSIMLRFQRTGSEFRTKLALCAVAVFGVGVIVVTGFRTFQCLRELVVTQSGLLVTRLHILIRQTFGGEEGRRLREAVFPQFAHLFAVVAVAAGFENLPVIDMGVLVTNAGLGALLVAIVAGQVGESDQYAHKVLLGREVGKHRRAAIGEYPFQRFAGSGIDATGQQWCCLRTVVMVTGFVEHSIDIVFYYR